ncbi:MULTISPECIES: hypothetical protein [Klebsiella]|uniref:hypothetical protein n=1 Tax=Klebsiella TaxID=570 RepID=UPI001CC91052|nr:MULTISPECIES: hypothetical protein [Klebsiella]WJD77941.1 hypothetical protein QRD21_12785 [Klebsiella michiganensis]
MDKFDRELQREILKVCIDAYPRTVDAFGNHYVSEIINGEQVRAQQKAHLSGLVKQPLT